MNTSVPLEVFVARNLGDPRVDTLLRGCENLVRETADGRAIRWTIPGINLAVGGLIGRDDVEPALERAEVVLAILDRANANVAWEAGLAHGLGKPVHFCVLSNAVTWTQLGSLSGLYLHHLRRPTDVSSVLSALRLEPTALRRPTQGGSASESCRRTGGGQATRLALPTEAGPALILCPSGIEGETLRAIVDRRFGERVRLAPPEGVKLHGLTSLVAGCSQAIWIVCGHNEPEAPDGASNTSNALIAGVLRGLKFPLQILRSTLCRVLADVAGEDTTFELSDFERKLATALTLRRELPDVTEFEPWLAQLVEPIVITKEEQRYAWRDCLSCVVDVRTDIDKLVRTLGIELKPQARQEAAKEIWSDALRQAQNRQIDLRPIVARALAVAPKDGELRRLAGVR